MLDRMKKFHRNINKILIESESKKLGQKKENWINFKQISQNGNNSI